jgi:hypothetical protein
MEVTTNAFALLIASHYYADVCVKSLRKYCGRTQGRDSNSLPHECEYQMSNIKCSFMKQNFQLLGTVVYTFNYFLRNALANVSSLHGRSEFSSRSFHSEEKMPLPSTAEPSHCSMTIACHV